MPKTNTDLATPAITVRIAAETLNVSIGTITRRCRLGYWPCHKIGAGRTADWLIELDLPQLLASYQRSPRGRKPLDKFAQ
jgi:hypothetical protein